MINLINPLKRLSQTDKIILDSVKKFTNTNLINYLDKHRHRELYKEMGDLGLLGCNLNRNNCLGLSNTMYGLVSKEIERVDSGFRSMLGVQSSLVMKTINDYGNKKVIDNYFDNLKLGNKIGSFALTEADSGSNVSLMKTNAYLKNNDYIINGSKTWITNAPIADIFIIWAKVDKKINGFVVDKDSKGLETTTINNKLSMTNTITGMIFLDNVVVPKENRLNVTGIKGPLNALNSARLGLSMGSLGAAEECIKIALDYTKNRELFGTKLCQKQIVQSKLVDMITKYNLSLSLTLEILNIVDNDEHIPEMISMIKMNNPQIALDIARTTRDLLGGNGITKEYNVFRHLTNLETVNTYEGTADIHKLILGKYFTGYSAF
tara:strand:+ start:511 stop:1641 length:1131 start_codon:yes stop_codon:yes gene_type:complete